MRSEVNAVTDAITSLAHNQRLDKNGFRNIRLLPVPARPPRRAVRSITSITH